MNGLSSIERKIIKRDAKIVLTQNWLRFLGVSLPVIVLEVLFALRMTVIALEWVKWLVIGIGALILYLPLSIGRDAYILGKILQKPCTARTVFRWITSLQRFGAAIAFGLVSFALYGVYAGICWLLYQAVSAGAAQLSAFTENPDMQEYMESAFLVLALLGASVLELFLSPAKNYLAKDEGALSAIKKSFQTAKEHFKPLLWLRLSWIGWIVGVYFFDSAVNGNITGALLQPNWWMNALYGLAAVLFYLLAFYVETYIHAANLSFNELCIVKSKNVN